MSATLALRAKQKTKHSLHPLARKQFEQVICRPAAVQRKMIDLWAVVFKPGDRTNTFLGKRFLPLGQSIMMVQYSELTESDGGERESVPVLGVKCQIDPDSGNASWDNIVLSHDLGLRAFAGAKGKIMDPEDDNHGNPRRRGKASWLEQALTVDACRRGAIGRNFKLAVVPVLPRLFYAVVDPAHLPFEDTPALRQRVERHMAVGGERHTPLAKMDDVSRGLLLKAEWPSVFIPPGEDGNTTRLYLVDHVYSTRVRYTTRIYECFDEYLIGIDVWNPMSDDVTATAIRAARIENPAKRAYTRLGLDPAMDKDMVTDEQYRGLASQMRACFPSSLYTEAILGDALTMPYEPVANLVRQHELFRAALKPTIAECCTAADVQWAIDHGNQPLHASGLCRIQVLRTDPRLLRQSALRFNSAALGRERVTAALYRP